MCTLETYAFYFYFIVRDMYVCYCVLPFCARLSSPISYDFIGFLLDVIAYICLVDLNYQCCMFMM